MQRNRGAGGAVDGEYSPREILLSTLRLERDTCCLRLASFPSSRPCAMKRTSHTVQTQRHRKRASMHAQRKHLSLVKACIGEAQSRKRLEHKRVDGIVAALDHLPHRLYDFKTGRERENGEDRQQRHY